MGYMLLVPGDVRLDGVSIHTWNKNDLATYWIFTTRNRTIWRRLYENIARFREPSRKTEFTERFVKDFEIYTIFEAFKNGNHLK